MGIILLLAAIFLIASQVSPGAQVAPVKRPVEPEPFTPFPPSPLPAPKPVPFTRDFIRWVQKSINKIMQTDLTVDGLLGPLTKEALISYQSIWGLVTDGIPGSNTEAAIKEDLQSGTTYFS